MSLDVYLTLSEPVRKSGTGVFVRVDGQNKELTVAEVKERWPDAEVDEQEYETDQVFHANITHNLNQMAEAASIYQALWCPEEIGINKASGLIVPLSLGLTALISDPEEFKKLNPPNGWGTYEGLVKFVQNYLTACIANPTADVSVSR